MTTEVLASNLTRHVRVAEHLARWAGQRLRALDQERNLDSRDGTRGGGDLLARTEAAITAHVGNVLAEHFPDDRIAGVTERTGAGEVPSALWVFDPVTGALNFTHGLAWSGFSIALADARGPVLGVVSDPWRNDLFSAVRGQGSRCNGRRLTVSAATDLSGQIVLIEGDGRDPGPDLTGLAGALAAHGCGVRTLGSPSLALVEVAAGRAVAAVIESFDTAAGLAGVVIGLEAGAVVLDLNGQSRVPVNGELLLAAPGVVVELYRIWRSRGMRADFVGG